MMLLKAATALLPVLVHRCIASTTKDFPTVDLGYARHAPTFVNTTSVNNISFATYSNIRFAEPPVGDLRFRAPVTPPPASHDVEDGVVPRNSTNCLQTWPAGFIAFPGLNGSTWGSEDCLFLDVLVPEGLEPASGGTGVPVLHWVYGGGYFSGGKDWVGGPEGLFDAMGPEEKFIVVASNYRLGQFGWMSSKTEPSMTPNAGLYDTWAALEWTRDHVHLFGGDPERVTAMGLSAGAGILQHFLAADTQGRGVPFHQVFLSSPGYRPLVDRSKEMTETYGLFLDATNCTDVACLRELPEEAMVEASKYMALTAPQGEWGAPGVGFTPVIDGDLVLDLPDRVLAENPQRSGRISRVIVGGMQNEGLGYANRTWPEFISLFARTPSNATIETIRKLYDTPTPVDPLLQTPFGDFYDEAIFSCHSYSTAKYWPSNPSDGSCSTCSQTETYRYEMSIPPATHGQDILYYFYTSAFADMEDVALEIPGANVVEDVALEFQKHLRRFIMGEDMEGWPQYHGEAPEAPPALINLTADGIETVVGGEELSLSERCETLMELWNKKEDGW